MTSITNKMMFDEEKYEISLAARNASKRGAKQEMERIKQGWRWKTVDCRTKIFVPCDEDGNPTKDGQIRIQRLKENLGIK